MSQNISIFILLATFCSFASSACPQWEWVTPSEVVLLRSNPDGYDFSTNTYMYLCRVNADGGRWIPGKVQFSSGRATCVFGVYGAVENRTEFQMVISSPGTTTWVSSNDTLPANAIPAGTHRGGKVSHACRGLHLTGPSLELGVWGIGTGKCFIIYDGRETTTDNNIEVLSLSAYGQLMHKLHTDSLRDQDTGIKT